MTDLLHAALLGIIEGLTEFLPVSSTGHLLIAEHWLGARSELFNVAIQAGAILASLLVFWPRLQQLLLGLSERANRDYLAKLVFAFLITALGGLVAKKAGLELPQTVAPVAGALIIGGVLMLLIEWLVAGRAACQRRHLARRVLGRRLPDPRRGLSGHVALRRDDLRRDAGRTDGASRRDRIRFPRRHPDDVRRNRLMNS